MADSKGDSENNAASSSKEKISESPSEIFADAEQNLSAMEVDTVPSNEEIKDIPVGHQPSNSASILKEVRESSQTPEAVSAVSENEKLQKVSKIIDDLSNDRGKHGLDGNVGNSEDGIVVLEEDDTDGEDSDDNGEKNSEESNNPKDSPAAEIKLDVKTEKDQDKKDDTVLLINPLYGKKLIKKSSTNIPVYDVDSQSSSGSEADLDFTSDVNLNNVSENNWANIAGHQQEPSCGCNCYHEKGILVNEIERLRKAIFEIGERHAVLEDFIEVEYGDRFEKFLKNRQHLVQMGFGSTENDPNDIDGKRSSKASELVELLKMIKEQADTPEDKHTSSNASHANAQIKPQPQKISSSSSKPYQQKPKAIPSISSNRNTSTTGRGGTINYFQRPVVLAPPASVMPQVLSRNPAAYQYQQQHLMGPPQTIGMSAAQPHYYYDNVHSNMAGGLYNAGNSSRGQVTVVGRNDLFPSGSQRFGYNTRNLDGSGSGYGGSTHRGAANSEDSKPSKKQRKRKRKSEISETGSTAASTTSSTATQKETKEKEMDTIKKSESLDELSFNKDDLNPSSKRICPVCSKILNRKHLRDHLIIHSGHNITCPVCKEEFFQRRKLKLHLRDAHDMPVSEYAVYIDRVYANIETQTGPTLDKYQKEAKVPTKEQVAEWAETFSASVEARKELKAAAAVENHSSSSTTNSVGANNAGSSSARTFNRDNAAAGSSGGIPSRSRPTQASTSGKSKYAPQSRSKNQPKDNNDLYGRGGYAQYAAKYLQERAAPPASRLYTPF